jgi:hypothetical protein
MPNGHPLLPICSTASDLRRHFSTIDSSRAGFMRQRLETFLRFLYMKQPSNAFELRSSRGSGISGTMHQR